MTQATPLETAVAALHAGGVIAYPTEAVWGLGCDPDDEAALTRLLRLKGRDPAKGVILVAADLDQLAPWLDGLSAAQREILSRPRPTPTTWLVPDNGRARRLVRGEHDRVALRVSDHPLVVALCRAFGGPIVSTSANRAGESPATSAEAIRAIFGETLDAILDGPLGGHERPSTIRDLVTGRVLRD
ncbi:L-threonylcarbamoyladenylate synthase [Halomonas nitroreducens]|uniref:Threonylcarbamoyl-AMP synthase n=1 Tax=Halomonas nitroreducens TaxID=447425 RepID=A0A431V241_9GAMM|nr:Sua5/YciO/YrdC/YwlC family protein [Halomonas nitroreducens]RTR02007.1 tRNA threonylcarbamoyladenosine biosynthesis protein RimN [Halomonas nitroreducens]